jgi:hypothetical protein
VPIVISQNVVTPSKTGIVCVVITLDLKHAVRGFRAANTLYTVTITLSDTLPGRSS